MPVDLPLGVTVIPLSREAKSLLDKGKASLAGGARIICETPAGLNNAFRRAGQKSFPARNTCKNLCFVQDGTSSFGIVEEERNRCTSL